MLAMAASVAGVVIGVSLWFPRTGPFRPRYWLQRRRIQGPQRSLAVVLTTAPLFRTRAEKYDAVIDCPPRAAPSSCGCCPSTPLQPPVTRRPCHGIKDDDTSERSVAIANLSRARKTGFVTYTRTARS